MLHESHCGLLHREPTSAAPLLVLCRALPRAVPGPVTEGAIPSGFCWICWCYGKLHGFWMDDLHGVEKIWLRKPPIVENMRWILIWVDICWCMNSFSFPKMLNMDYQERNDWSCWILIHILLAMFAWIVSRWKTMDWSSSSWYSTPDRKSWFSRGWNHILETIEWGWLIWFGGWDSLQLDSDKISQLYWDIPLIYDC